MSYAMLKTAAVQRALLARLSKAMDAGEETAVGTPYARAHALHALATAAHNTGCADIAISPEDLCYFHAEYLAQVPSHST